MCPPPHIVCGCRSREQGKAGGGCQEQEGDAEAWGRMGNQDRGRGLCDAVPGVEGVFEAKHQAINEGSLLFAMCGSY